MLARTRLELFSVVPLLVIFAVCAPVWAQIHGVPPSVTSFGFGGSNNPAPGIPASVTSLGPNGFGDGPFIFGNCCFGPNFGVNFGPNLAPNFRRSHPPLLNGRREHHHHHEFPVGTIMPVYVPYAVPVAAAGDETPEDEDADMDTAYSRGVLPAYERGPSRHDAPPSREVDKSGSTPKTSSAPVAHDPPAPVAAQPPTLLVFKDGHKSEVQNYAIVGGTLFDFSDGRTHKILLADLDVPATQKANEDRGVDFQIPLQKAKNDKAK